MCARTRRAIVAEIDSTSAEAARRAAAGEAGPLWILARRQTAGRGRRGRPWASAEGNLAASLLMPVPEDLGVAALRSFVAGLALYDALAAATGRADLLALKWPNDVLLAGGKVAGILLETVGRGMVIGFGVNLAVAPGADAVEQGAVTPVSVRAATGATVGPEAFLDLIDPAFAAWEARLVTEGFEPLRAAFLERATGRGAEVLARLPDREMRGRFEDVDDRGALVLLTAAGPMTLPAAELHFVAGDPSDAPRH
jgi:BirA family transcriptional regulator, biotin operon repressor / biotin---[acetyl-CoA-carboxylase] ligase